MINNITSININNNYKKRTNVSFRSVLSPVMTFLNDNPALAMVGVDLCSMVIPRSIVDMKRGFDAGAETAFRESTCSLNMATMGLVGFAVASLFPNVQGVKANKIFANNENIDAFAKLWHSNLQNNASKNISEKELRKSFMLDVFSKMEGLNTQNGISSWNKINNKKTLSSIEKVLDSAIVEDEKNYKFDKKFINKIKSIVINDTNAEKIYRINLPDGKILNGTLDEFLDNSTALGKAFSKENVKNLFKKSTNYVENSFVKALKGRKTATALGALALTAGIGMSLQPINRMITKKRTGSDGFVGVEGRSADKSSKFKALKIAVATAWTTFALSTIGLGKNLLNKLQYKSKVPSINQFKLVYGMVIASRFLAARDKNELREISIKDFLGFFSWLMLGGFVSNVVAKKLDKSLINYDKNLMGDGFWNKLTKSQVKSHKEILSEFGALTVDEAGNKLSISKALETIVDSAKKSGAKIKIRNKDFSQLAGYLFSGLVLGILVPKLNIALTKHFDSKNKKAIQNKSEINFSAKQNVSDKSYNSETFKAFEKIGNNNKA